jgi:protein-S-isoprenylcysteine O-methyltransferase Ste14
MSFLDHRIPPPLVGVSCGIAMLYLAWLTPLINVPNAARLITAIGLGVAGVLVMLAGVVSFRHAKTTVNPLKPETATALVVSGVYRHTRNPMYLGMLLLLIGWAIYLSAPAALIGVIVFWLYIERFQIRPEERALADLFGTAFAEYTSQVRRWI